MALSKNLTAGPILVGVLISTFLYGISTLQTYNYSRIYAKDPLWLRCLIVRRVLETVLTVLTCAYQYSISVTNFGNYGVYNDLPWTIAITFFLSGFIGGIVQSFFAWRIFVISGHWWTSLPPWLGSLARVGVVIAMCTFTLQTHSRSVYEDQYGWTIDLALSLALFTDAWNTICLCYYLHTRRSKHRKCV
ncbi:hypothetical protein WOLCODRAFT_84980 [Wolfiporia cocos MD-104 SS10]|uniref:Uncharacterized protein n=1 Tax=Wolfiporia cocos (strain MD-104) TaxID=742152 RepID=A0A2H3JAV2_WOLCO|nr:hypothetical protein WOLCODRAFT_84980 [Wolfiporia cocos MD-104 SS10]